MTIEFSRLTFLVRASIIFSMMLALLFAGQALLNAQPAMGNHGRVKKIYIAEFNGTTVHPGQRIDLVDTLRAKNIDVCLSRYIFCYGSDVTTANQCYPGTDDRDGDLTVDSLPMDRIAPLLPLNKSGKYQRIEVGGSSFRFDTLSISEKLDILPLIAHELYALRWEDGKWTNGNIVVTATDTLESAVTDDELVKRASSWWKSRASNQNKRFASDSTVYLDWEWICGTGSIEECQTEVRDRLSRFSQDQFLVRADGMDSSCLTALNRPYWNSLKKRRMSCYASQLCGCAHQRNSCDSVRIDSLAIRGGNYFVRDSIVLIGSDVASYYRYCKNWWSTLGFNFSPSMDSLEQALGSLITGSPRGKVMWVGDGSPDTIVSYDCSSYPLEGRHTQPIYHIDLFFHPLGTMGDNKDFHYVIALLTDSLHSENTVRLSEYKIVQKRLTATADSLKHRLDNLGFNPCPIEVPLVFYGGSAKGSAYIAFANGISEKTESGFRYFIPDYLNSVSFKYEEMYDTTLMVAESALKAAGVDVVRITSSYGMVSALHCMTKVMRRED